MTDDGYSEYGTCVASDAATFQGNRLDRQLCVCYAEDSHRRWLK